LRSRELLATTLRLIPRMDSQPYAHFFAGCRQSTFFKEKGTETIVIYIRRFLTIEFKFKKNSTESECRHCDMRADRMDASTGLSTDNTG
jgi:hypothetical protein